MSFARLSTPVRMSFVSFVNISTPLSTAGSSFHGRGDAGWYCSLEHAASH
jgi:hypothetical protein